MTKPLRIGQVIFIHLLIVLLASGCSFGTLYVNEQPSVYEHPLTVIPGQRFGQSFVATYDGLQGVHVMYRADQPVTLDCALRKSSDSSVDLRQSTQVLPASEGFSPVEILFDPVHDSAYRDHYLSCLVVPGSGRIDVQIGTSLTYMQGALHHDDEPGDAQLTFQLLYDRGSAVFTLVKSLAGSFLIVLLSMLAFVLPGWALLVILWPERERFIPDTIGTSVGLSLAIYPVLFMFTHMVGLHLGVLYTWLPIGAAIIVLLAHFSPWKRESRQHWVALVTEWYRSDAFLPDVTWILVIAIVFAVRFIVIRTLDAPMWGDAYQHTVITQLLIDHGGLFSSWEPYAPFATFTYHFGFHTQMAVLHWLTGLDATQSVLWGGQLMNGLAIVTLAPLTARLVKRRWAVVYGAVIAGTLMSMPMFYANWGRFTQLAGQVLLPVAIALSLDLLQSPHRDRRKVILGWLIIGGLALTHLRILIFYVVFIFAWLLMHLSYQSVPRMLRDLRAKLSRIVWLAVGGGLLFLPWFLHGVGGAIQRIFLAQLSTPASQTSSHISSYNAIGLLTDYTTTVMWLLLFVGAAFALWNKERLLSVLVLWCFVMLLITNPVWLNLPGSGAISNFALFIAIYIPAGVLIAYLCDVLLDTVSHHRVSRYGVALLCVAVALYGASQRRADIQPERYAYLTRPDIRAATWMAQNLPDDAYVWINGFLAYADTVVVGSDGAWWLPITAGRETTIPARFGAETWADPKDRTQITETMVAYRDNGDLTADEMVAHLRQLGVTHVCIGQRNGTVNNFGAPVMNYHMLVDSPDFTPVYHEDLVWVFELDGQE